MSGLSEELISPVGSVNPHLALCTMIFLAYVASCGSTLKEAGSDNDFHDGSTECLPGLDCAGERGDIQGETGETSSDSHEVKPEALHFKVMTFNVGTSSQTRHDRDEKEGMGDGYTSEQADWIDKYYGNSLAWIPAEKALQKFIADEKPEIVAFQEMMYDPWCEDAPPPPEELDLVCNGYTADRPYTAQRVLGSDYRVASTALQEDNWVAIRSDFGSFKGCPDDGPCIGGAFGLGLGGECNKRPRISSIEIVLNDGREFVLVNIHATSGMTETDMACRAQQFDQIFKDRGDGQPAAFGKVNLAMGDINTDPFLFAAADPSAAQWNKYVGPGKAYRYISTDSADGPSTHSTTMRIDHVVSDTFEGECVVPGSSPGIEPVLQSSFFDHKPVLCQVVWQ